MTRKVNNLNDNERRALEKIKSRIRSLYPVSKFILFGSKARGDSSVDSDIDLLIVTQRELQLSEKHIISAEIFRINIEHDVLFSFVSIDEAKWNSDIYQLYPIHANIEHDGVLV